MWSHDRLCFTGLDAGLWPRLLTHYWLEEEAPTKSLSSFLSPFLSIFSPFSEPLSPFPHASVPLSFGKQQGIALHRHSHSILPL